MNVFDPDPSLRWLFAFTHPDDEISIAAWMHRLVARRAEVWAMWTHSTSEREQEARAAAELIGIPQDHLIFLDGDDGRILHQIPQLLPQFEEVMATIKPNRVACGAFEQGHLDHDATNYLVNRSFKQQVLEIPFYHVYTSRVQVFNKFTIHDGEDVIDLSPDEKSFKRLIARQYPSQNIYTLLLLHEAWQTARGGQRDLDRVERMRVQPPTDFKQPAHPPSLASKVKKSEKWKSWLKSIEAVEAELKSATPVTY